MGNQGASGEGVRKVCEWIWNGEIGEVRKVETFTDRPIWPQGLARPEDDERIPKTMNWDAFIGPAPTGPTTRSIRRGTSADGGTSAPAPWATWPATSCIRCSRP